MCVSVFLNLGVCTNVYSMCTLWCQPCPFGLHSPSSCSLHWVTFLGRALGQSSCLVHLYLPPFYSVSCRWAPLSDTCNYTVTFLHLLLHPHPSFTTKKSHTNTHINPKTDTNILCVGLHWWTNFKFHTVRTLHIGQTCKRMHWVNACFQILQMQCNGSLDLSTYCVTAWCTQM